MPSVPYWVGGLFVFAGQVDFALYPFETHLLRA